jgi:exopolysaccharide biosynthesis protein
MLAGWYNPTMMSSRRSGLTLRWCWLLAAAGAACLGGAPAIAGPDSITWRRVSVSGCSVNVVEVNLNDPQVRIGACVARGFPRGSESFRSMLDRARPDAAIDGTFFSKASLHPVGDLVVAGKHVFKGGVGTALAATDDGRIDFVSATGYHQRDWSDYETVLAAGPRLLADGQVVLAPWREGFQDRHMTNGSAVRSAVGVTANRRLLLVTVPRAVTLRSLAGIMRSLGARDAINLDGGSSSALYCEGKVLTAPGRSLTNLLVVYSTAERYRSVASLLVPPSAVVLPAPKPVELPPPAVEPFQIVRPTGEGSLSGRISIMALAREGAVPDYVTFAVDGCTVGVTNCAPYACVWDTREVSDGSHRITASGYLKDSAVAQVAEIEVVVANSGVAALPHPDGAN